jgi:hypothetical protein
VSEQDSRFRTAATTTTSTGYHAKYSAKTHRRVGLGTAGTPTNDSNLQVAINVKQGPTGIALTRILATGRVARTQFRCGVQRTQQGVASGGSHVGDDDFAKRSGHVAAFGGAAKPADSQILIRHWIVGIRV